MTTIHEIFQEFAPAYIEKFGNKMPEDHLKVINAIVNCRTEAYGLSVYECTKCGLTHFVFRSCGNRHCPNCQYAKSIEWMKKQMEKLLPCHYFMVTFTVPATVRELIRSNQRLAYNAMFKAASDTMKKLAKDDRYIGGDVSGFMSVLHTWSRQLLYHPHLHCVVPGGAYSKSDHRWLPSREDFYLPVHAMSKIYRAKFRDEMEKAGLLEGIPKSAWQESWNVNVQPVGNAESAIKYLSSYVFRVAISDHRIVSVENGKVTIQYKKSGSNRPRHLELDAEEFLRRFLQHTLPTGFMKIRYFGFLSPNSGIDLEDLRGLIELNQGFEVEQLVSEKSETEPPTLYCPVCKGELRYRFSILPHMMTKPFEAG